MTLGKYGVVLSVVVGGQRIFEPTVVDFGNVRTRGASSREALRLDGGPGSERRAARDTGLGLPGEGVKEHGRGREQRDDARDEYVPRG